MRNESPPRFTIPPEEEPVMSCSDCGCPLYEGNYAYRIEEEVFCEECLYEKVKDICFYVERDGF